MRQSLTLCELVRQSLTLFEKIRLSCKQIYDEFLSTQLSGLNPLLVRRSLTLCEKIGSSCKDRFRNRNKLKRLITGLNPLKIGSSCKIKKVEYFGGDYSISLNPLKIGSSCKLERQVYKGDNPEKSQSPENRVKL